MRPSNSQTSAEQCFKKARRHVSDDVQSTGSPEPKAEPVRLADATEALGKLGIRVAPRLVNRLQVGRLKTDRTDSPRSHPSSPKKRKAASSIGGGSILQEEKVKRKTDVQVDISHARGALGQLLVEFGKMELNMDMLEAIRQTESQSGIPKQGEVMSGRVDRAVFDKSVSQTRALLVSQLATLKESTKEPHAIPHLVRAYALRTISLLAEEDPSSSEGELFSDDEDDAIHSDAAAGAMLLPSQGVISSPAKHTRDRRQHTEASEDARPHQRTRLLSPSPCSSSHGNAMGSSSLILDNDNRGTDSLEHKESVAKSEIWSETKTVDDEAVASQHEGSDASKLQTSHNEDGSGIDNKASGVLEVEAVALNDDAQTGPPKTPDAAQPLLDGTDQDASPALDGADILLKRLSMKQDDNREALEQIGEEQEESEPEEEHDDNDENAPDSIALSDDQLSKAAGKMESSEPAVWGSSLVCADLTVDEVASKYWPFLQTAVQDSEELGGKALTADQEQLINGLVDELNSEIVKSLKDTPMETKPGFKSLIAATIFDDVLKEHAFTIDE